MKIAFICYFLAALLLIVFGLIYLFRPEFMPYHADAISRQWEQVEPTFQVLVLALMRVVGGAWVACSVAIVIILLIQFRQGEVWARWTILLIGMFASVPALYATLYVTQQTPATAPWVGVAVGMLLLVMGFCFSFHKAKK